MNVPSKQAEVGPRFDWMQKTIPEDPAEVYDVLAGTLGAELVPGRGFNGYHRSMAISRDGETLAKVLYGGPNGWPNVITSGAVTDEVEPVLAVEEEGLLVVLTEAAVGYHEALLASELSTSSQWGSR